MNTKLVIGASFAALAMGFGGAGVASAQGSNPAPNMQNESSGMGAAMGRDSSSPMGHQMRGGMHRGRMQGGMMGGCPMMDGMMGGMMGGANAKVMMQMHGEMLRAMGDIMVKYADKIQVAPAEKMP